MVPSGMLRRVALVWTDVSEELSASFQVIFLRSVRRLLVTASVVPSLPILVALMKEALSSSETSVLTSATWHNIPEDTILHSHRRENLKSYDFTSDFSRADDHILFLSGCYSPEKQGWTTEGSIPQPTIDPMVPGER
jgi:hypothetical protein